MINEHFSNKQHQIQETDNNYFRQRRIIYSVKMVLRK